MGADVATSSHLSRTFNQPCGRFHAQAFVQGFGSRPSALPGVGALASCASTGTMFPFPAPSTAGLSPASATFRFQKKAECRFGIAGLRLSSLHLLAGPTTGVSGFQAYALHHQHRLSSRPTRHSFTVFPFGIRLVRRVVAGISVPFPDLPFPATRRSCHGKRVAPSEIRLWITWISGIDFRPPKAGAAAL